MLGLWKPQGRSMLMRELPAVHPKQKTHSLRCCRQLDNGDDSNWWNNFLSLFLWWNFWQEIEPALADILEPLFVCLFCRYFFFNLLFFSQLVWIIYQNFFVCFLLVFRSSRSLYVLGFLFCIVCRCGLHTVWCFFFSLKVV